MHITRQRYCSTHHQFHDGSRNCWFCQQEAIARMTDPPALPADAIRKRELAACVTVGVIAAAIVAAFAWFMIAQVLR